MSWQTYLSDLMAKILYKGRWFTAEEISSKGKPFERVRIQDAVCIVPILDGGKILLEYHDRPVVGKRMYELPAGLIEEDESPSHAARRELAEETGYAPKKLRHLVDAYMSPGILTEFAHFYLATGLLKVSRKTDADERTATRLLGIGTVSSLIEKNKILNAHSIIGILYYLRYIAKGTFGKRP